MSAALADESEVWRVAVGAGVANLPKYPGSGATQTRPLPLVSVRYGRFFIGGVPGAGTPAGLGVYLHENEHWSIGLAVGGDVIKPRKESDDVRLRGLGDISSTARGGVFGSYTLDWFTLRGSVLSDLGGNHAGTLASLDAEARYSPTNQLTLSAGPGLAWANTEYMQAFFGVNAAQAAHSSFAEYSPKSGIALVRLESQLVDFGGLPRHRAEAQVLRPRQPADITRHGQQNLAPDVVQVAVPHAGALLLQQQAQGGQGNHPYKEERCQQHDEQARAQGSHQRSAPRR
jgi:outer membrane protein